jgi:hypothetical protein
MMPAVPDATREIWEQTVEQWRKDYRGAAADSYAHWGDLAEKMYVEGCEGKETDPRFADSAPLYARRWLCHFAIKWANGQKKPKGRKSR